MSEPEAHAVATDAANPRCKPYSLPSDDWPGLAKLVEECGDVLEAAGKIMGGSGASYLLRDRLSGELADLLAVTAFVIEANGLDGSSFSRRRADTLRSLYSRVSRPTETALAGYDALGGEA